MLLGERHFVPDIADVLEEFGIWKRSQTFGIEIFGHRRPNGANRKGSISQIEEIEIEHQAMAIIFR